MTCTVLHLRNTIHQSLPKAIRRGETLTSYLPLLTPPPLYALLTNLRDISPHQASEYKLKSVCVNDIKKLNLSRC